MIVTPGPAASSSAPTPGHPLQGLPFRQTHQQQVGAVDHLPSNRLACLQVEGGSQGEGEVVVDLHGTALAADALQADRVVIFKAGYIYVIT